MQNRVKEVIETTAEIYKAIGRDAMDLSPFTQDETDTPLCIAPSIVVSKRAHNILFSLALISINSFTYAITSALLLPWEKDTIIDQNGQVLEMEMLNSKMVFAAGTGLFFSLAAGVTLLCTKKTDVEGDNSIVIPKLKPQ